MNVERLASKPIDARSDQVNQSSRASGDVPLRDLVELDGRLPALLEGAVKPKDDAERIELAALCTLKRWHAAAARFYADAFASTPAMAEDTQKKYRYNAACAAALAGCGVGMDADKLDDKQRAMWRTQARDWLHLDLKWWNKTLEKGDAQSRDAIGQTMLHWQTDEDFAGVRDNAALARLPESEQQAWRKLWSDVESLRKKASATK